ncbi:CcmD family protein [Haladaptatus sp. NG-WS-4]
MEPLLIAGYSIVFLTIFAYVLRLQRRLSSVEDSLRDLQ